MSDWLDLVRVEPAYRAHFADGSRLDVHADVDAMAEEIDAVCGGGQRAGLSALRRLRHPALPLGDAQLHRPQHRLAARPGAPGPAPAGRAPAASAGWRRWSRRTCRTSDCSGCSPSRRCTPGSRRTKRSRSTPSSPTWTRWRACASRGAGCTPCPTAMAAAAEKHGVEIRYGTTVVAVERSGGRAVAVRTADGERIPCRRRRPDPRPAGRLARAARPGTRRPLPALAVVLPAARRVAATLRRAPAPQDPLRPGLGVDLPRDPRRPAEERPVAAGQHPDALRSARWRPTAGRSTTCWSPTPNLDGPVDWAAVGPALPRARARPSSSAAATSASATASRSSR